jgi:exopolysaccharide production protein ExoZ
MRSRTVSAGPSTSDPATRLGTLNNVQALRAIAAIMVVAEHIDFIGVGWSGVDIFFVISGFVIAKTGRQGSAAQFYTRRLFRIVPIYWLGTILVFTVALIAPSLLRHTTTDVPSLVKSLFFIPYVKSSGLLEPVLFLGWTLNYEMFFYTLYALSIWIFPRHRSLAAGLTIAVLIGLGAAIPVDAQPFKFWTGSIMAEFVLGLVVFEVWNRGYLSRCPGWLAVTAVAGLVALMLRLEHSNIGWFRPLVFGPPAVLIVALALASERSVRVPMILLATGDASYSLYLFHPYATVPIQLILARLKLSPWWDAPVAAVLITVSVAVALIAYRLIERPSNLWLRERFAHAPAPASAVRSSADA